MILQRQRDGFEQRHVEKGGHAMPNGMGAAVRGLFPGPFRASSNVAERCLARGRRDLVRDASEDCDSQGGLCRLINPATSCNCSLCRRSGGIWAYYEFGTVTIQGHPENTEDYIWGDRTLRNVRCKTCGIVTHREPLEAKPGARHGVNLRNFEPKLLESVVVRRFDGADTWTFLD